MDALKLKLQRIREQYKHNAIPSCNHALYELVWRSFEPEIINRPDEYNKLTQELLARMEALQDPDLSALPPNLYRDPAEPVDTWLDRCYHVWLYGFSNNRKETDHA